VAVAVAETEAEEPHPLKLRCPLSPGCTLLADRIATGVELKSRRDTLDLLENFACFFSFAMLVSALKLALALAATPIFVASK
jgi:hypothetical protein